MRLRPGMAVNLLTGERRDVSTFTNVVAMAGIGHPPRFFTATLESCGVQPVKTVALADHQALSQADVAALVTADQTLLMTEKDAVKCRDFAAANWWYLPVDAIMADERAQRLLADLAERGATLTDAPALLAAVLEFLTENLHVGIATIA